MDNSCLPRNSRYYNIASPGLMACALGPVGSPPFPGHAKSISIGTIIAGLPADRHMHKRCSYRAFCDPSCIPNRLKLKTGGSLSRSGRIDVRRDSSYFASVRCSTFTSHFGSLQYLDPVFTAHDSQLMTLRRLVFAVVRC